MGKCCEHLSYVERLSIDEGRRAGLSRDNLECRPVSTSFQSQGSRGALNSRRAAGLRAFATR